MIFLRSTSWWSLHSNAQCTIQYWVHLWELLINSSPGGFRSQLLGAAFVSTVTQMCLGPKRRLPSLMFYLIYSLLWKLLFSLIKQEADGQLEAQVSTHVDEGMKRRRRGPRRLRECLQMYVWPHANINTWKHNQGCIGLSLKGNIFIRCKSYFYSH